MKVRKIAGKIILTAIMACGALLFVLPLFWMISSSLKKPLEVFEYPISWIPDVIQWNNYKEVWFSDEVPFARMYGNSIFIVILSLVGSVLISSLAAYAFARLKFKGKNIVFMLLLGTMMIPNEVIIIPRFMIFHGMGLYNNLWALILPAWYNITAVFLLRQFYMGLPNELFEAAKVDGASHLCIWAKLVTPLTKSALISVSILGFITSWNDYLNPLIFLVKKELYTVSLGIQYYLLSEAQEFNLTMTAATIAIVPVILLFVFGQKYFIEGIAHSGMKE